MMPKVIDHRHAARFASHRHAPLDALERCERLLDLRIAHAAMPGAGRDGKGIADIQFANEGDLEFEIRNLNSIFNFQIFNV